MLNKVYVYFILSRQIVRLMRFRHKPFLKKWIMTKWCYLIALCFNITLHAQMDTFLVRSTALDTEIQVFTYDINPENPDKPIIYCTDGKKMLDNGILAELQQLTQKGKITEAFYVFVSTIDPVTEIDHRNDYFFSNPSYLQFFEEELLPLVESRWKQSFTPKDRALVGISFGGLNGAYFSAQSKVFQQYALLSPVTYPRPSINQDIVFSENKSLRIFLSTGKLDAEKYVNILQQLYQGKSYEVEVLTTAGGHDFDNWNGQWRQVLNFLFPQ